MEQKPWIGRQYDRAEGYVADHEEEARQSAVLDCGREVYALLPKGLPALKIRFHGLFMIAPLPLLIVCVIFLPLSGFLGEWEVNVTTLGISAFCLIMLAGLFRVILFMLNNRDMFPRKYFVTLGPEGLAMHFNRIHFPGTDPHVALAWKEIESVQRATALFLPALLIGRLRVPALNIASRQGTPVVIPLHGKPDELEREFKAMETLIRQRMRG